MRRGSVLLTMAIAGGLVAQGIVDGPPVVRPKEKRLLVTADSLTAWGFKGIDPSLQKFRTRYNSLSKTTRFISEYEQKASPANDDTRIRVHSDAEPYPTVELAQRMFAAEVSGTKIGTARVVDATLTDASQLLTMGDENYSAYLMIRGEKHGNIFIFRQGRVVHSLTISGVYFARHGQVRKLLEPIYQESQRQFPD